MDPVYSFRGRIFADVIATELEYYFVLIVQHCRRPRETACGQPSSLGGRRGVYLHNFFATWKRTREPESTWYQQQRRPQVPQAAGHMLSGKPNMFTKRLATTGCVQTSLEKRVGTTRRLRSIIWFRPGERTSQYYPDRTAQYNNNGTPCWVEDRPVQ